MPPTAEEGARPTIARRAGIVAVGTLGSRVLGAVRDSVIAATFPLAATDAFFVAFTIPNALRVILGEGAVSAAFVPVLVEVRAKEGEERARAFYASLRGAMTLVLLVVTVLGVLGAPWIVLAYAAGYGDDPLKLGAATDLTRWLFPYIFFMGLAALGMGALNSLHRFAVPAFAPALLNVAMIAAALLLVPFAGDLGLPPIGALAIGALVGGALQVVVQWPSLRSAGYGGLPRFDFRDPRVREAFSLLAPLVAGLGVYQLNLILSRLFASFLADGAQSFLYYAQRVVEIPQGMFALAIATATLPQLAALRAAGKDTEAKSLFAHSLRLSLFVSVPATLVLIALAEPTITVLFGRGEFRGAQVHEAALNLAWQAGGIWAIASVRSVVQMFYAHKRPRLPVLGSLANLIVFTGSALLLMPTYGHVGIAIAISAAGAAQLVVLLLLLRPVAGALPVGEIAGSGARTLVAGAVAAAAAYGVAQLGDWSRGGNDLRNLAVYAGAAASSMAVYFAAARLLRAPELAEIIARRRRPGRDR
jgi:putative peptidoglycan lipid II flippase